MKKRVLKRNLFSMFVLVLNLPPLWAIYDGNSHYKIEPDTIDRNQFLPGEDEQTAAAYWMESGSSMSNIPGTNRMNALSGKIPGLMVIQNNGIIGEEGAGLFIRGVNTFGIGGNEPLILLDGVQTDISQIDPYDIESVTVLKDAVATAMYGLRSGNGVILITTRKGRAGSTKVSFNSQLGWVRPTKIREYLGAYDYAILYNEALQNEGYAPKYNEEDLGLFLDGSSPYTHPNVNWRDEFLRKQSLQTRNNINISGGNEMAKYFLSVGYVTQQGIFNTDQGVNSYSTNNQVSLGNIHSNVDLCISPDLTVNLDLRARQDRTQAPGNYNSNYNYSFFNVLNTTAPLAHPIFNMDGSLAGTPDYRNNPYGMLNNSGYSVWKRSYLSGKANADWSLDAILPGLSLTGAFGISNYGDHITNRPKSFAVYQGSGLEENKIGQDSEMSNFSLYGDNVRYMSGQVGMTFNKEFGRHALGATLKFDRSTEKHNSNQLPRVYQGLLGGISYDMDSKYMVDFVFSYQGSEQFPSSNRYGFFPALGFGWELNREDFWPEQSIMDQFKFRASAGLTGNDFDPYQTNYPYFGYLSNYSSGSGYLFGINANNNDGGFSEVVIANDQITWEKILKYNLGLDLKMFKSSLSVTLDYFMEKNDDILIYGVNSGLLGANFWSPTGKTENSGVDGIISWNIQREEYGYYLTVNGLYAKNKIVEQAEEARAYEWMYRTGHSITSRFGYVFDRYFTETDDLTALPDQSLLGSVQPGDIKYRDLNGDGIINENDQTVNGKGVVPDLFYGIGGGAFFKGFDVSFLFQGASGLDKLFSGPSVYEFLDGKGNVSSIHKQRWQVGLGQNAEYPRLGVFNVSNNRVVSDFWVKDTGYLRLKYVELGYDFAKDLRLPFTLTKARLFVSGYNLFTIDDLDNMDPEEGSSGNGYPIPKIFSVGLNLSF